MTDKNKICTTVEQSNKFIELGIDVNTADMCYCQIVLSSNKTEPKPIAVPPKHPEDIPAWSLSALLKLAEAYCMQTDTIGKHFIASEKGQYITDSYDEPLDAAFEMVCWLLENGIL